MPSRRHAFTLIEILMVVALIGIVAGFAISRFSYWSYRMDANIRLLQNIIIGAQQTAITKNVTVQVMFDANDQRVRILQDFNSNGLMDASDEGLDEGLGSRCERADLRIAQTAVVTTGVSFALGAGSTRRPVAARQVLPNPRSQVIQ